MLSAPTLFTDRLVLRPFARSDFDAYAAFMGSARAVHMHGPVSKEKAWDWFTNDIATWALYGFGALAITPNGASCLVYRHSRTTKGVSHV